MESTLRAKEKFVRTRALLTSSALIATAAMAAPAMASHAIGGDPSTYGTITIAVEGPLTGQQASNGQDMLRGVRLAVQQYNAKGGFYGRKVRIVQANDKADPSLAKSVANKVIKGPAVAVVGPYNSSVGLVNLPMYTRAKVVPVQMTSTDDTTGLGVTVQPKNSQISPVEFNYISKAFAPSKVSMLVDPSAYTQSMADRLERSLKARGVLVTQIPISDTQTDFTPQINQALTNNPTVVYLSTYFPQGAAIAKQLLATGNPAKCFAGLANQDPAFITQAGIPASRNCVFSGVPDPSQFPTARNYVKAYKKAFPGKTPGTWGTFTYDSANILFAAWKRAHDPFNYGKVLAQLKKTRNFAGATGKITINSRGNRPNVPVSILSVDARGDFNIITTDRSRK
jgi:branched-chain amino acid transport system substrate-binding protein